jgi:pimeloyl-ACP methyl ester carboxylesterase
MCSCLRLRYSNAQFQEKFNNVKIDSIQTLGTSVRFIEFGNNSQNTVIFIHGSPASSRIYKGFYADTALLRSAKIVTLDRPGYGYTQFGKSMPSILEQCLRILPVIEQYKNTNIVLVASSYGGPVAAYIASKIKTKALVLIAPALQKETERYFWFNPLLNTPVVRYVFPKTFRVANDEKLYHAKALAQVEKDFESINTSIYYLQGQKDKIVSIKNAQFVFNTMKLSTIDTSFVPNIGHSLIWNAPQLITNTILKAINTNGK